MHDIEPYQRWQDEYESANDKRSPFYGRAYEEFLYTQKIYNYYIHPLWDEFGSPTLYMKIIFADYEEGFAIFEMLGEWNDCLTNDIMFLKRDVVDRLIKNGISKFLLLCDNVLNFHGSDDCYYEEWYDDVKDEGGWICLFNLYQHVENEMKDTHLDYYVHFGRHFNEVNWRRLTPQDLIVHTEELMNKRVKRIK